MFGLTLEFTKKFTKEIIRKNIRKLNIESIIELLNKGVTGTKIGVSDIICAIQYICVYKIALACLKKADAILFLVVNINFISNVYSQCRSPPIDSKTNFELIGGFLLWILCQKEEKSGTTLMF